MAMFAVMAEGVHFVRFGWSTAQVTSISSAARPSGLTSPLNSFTATALPSCNILQSDGWLCCRHLVIRQTIAAFGLRRFALHCTIRRHKEKHLRTQRKVSYTRRVNCPASNAQGRGSSSPCLQQRRPRMLPPPGRLPCPGHLLQCAECHAGAVRALRSKGCLPAMSRQEIGSGPAPLAPAKKNTAPLQPRSFIMHQDAGLAGLSCREC